MQNTLHNKDRLKTLRQTLLLDSETEASFDRLTKLAANMIGAPVSLVSLVEPHRQFFKSQIGLKDPYATTRQTTIDLSFCQHVVTSGEPLVVNDAPNHALVCDNPAIVELDVMAYLGIPLTTRDGHHLGSLCVIDDEARTWTADEIDIMQTLAASVTTEIQLRLDAVERESLVTTLQERNDQLDAFSHTVSHNLKNAISGIVGCADVSIRYADRIDKTELIETMGDILDAANQTNDTINALLTLSGINLTGDTDLRPLPMFAILEDALTRLEREIAAYGATVQLPQGLPDSTGHRPWIEEVWLNYLSNALKYGGRPPHIEIGADVAPDGRVTYWIEDNGPGIPAEDQDKLFQTFSRVSPDPDIEGHGLGLSIVKRIVEKLDGRVGFKSTVGTGSRFFFTLPGA